MKFSPKLTKNLTTSRYLRAYQMLFGALAQNDTKQDDNSSLDDNYRKFQTLHTVRKLKKNCLHKLS